MRANIDWAQNILINKGLKLFGQPNSVVDTPWSKVFCFATSAGKIYLKSMEKSFNYEAIVIDFLLKQKFLNLPAIITINNEDHSFLMHDAGEPLRNILKQNYDLKLIKLVLKSYAKLQIKCIPIIDSLINKGAMDFRSNNLNLLYNKFIEHNRDQFLSDGLTLEEMNELNNLNQTFTLQLTKLANFKIPETIEHGDFHDNNILIKDKEVTFNDFGDTAITHPFFSIGSFLNSAERHHHLRSNDVRYVMIRDLYLNEWLDYGDHNDLLEAFNIAYKLRSFIWALSFMRIKPYISFNKFPQYRGYLADAMKNLLNNYKMN